MGAVWLTDGGTGYPPPADPMGGGQRVPEAWPPLLRSRDSPRTILTPRMGVTPMGALGLSPRGLEGGGGLGRAGITWGGVCFHGDLQGRLQPP